MIESFHVVDAFAAQPFSGNPAAICMVRTGPDEEWMRRIAGELYFSETSFVFRDGDSWRLRWFTPVVEIELSGHSTLACAHVLWEVGAVDRGAPIEFATMGGVLTARRSGQWIELDFPLQEVSIVDPPRGLSDALGVEPVAVASDGEDYLVELESEQQLRAVVPDFDGLAAIGGPVAITAPSSSAEYDFVSRFFAPQNGVPEDAVTGAAHCFLGPYWSKRLGREELVAYQASERGGVVRVAMNGTRVRLGGTAVTVLSFGPSTALT